MTGTNTLKKKNYCSPYGCFVWPSNFFNALFSETQFLRKYAPWSQNHSAMNKGICTFSLSKKAREEEEKCYFEKKFIKNGKFCRNI